MKTKPAKKIKKNGKKTISEVKQAFRQPAVRRRGGGTLFYRGAFVCKKPSDWRNGTFCDSADIRFQTQKLFLQCGGRGARLPAFYATIFCKVRRGGGYRFFGSACA